MATTINFLDELGNPIPQTQVTLLDKYIRVITINGRTKINEYYSEEKMYQIDYYLDADDIVEDIVSSYDSINLDTIETLREINSYKVVLHKSYVQGVLKSATEMVEDSEGNAICAYLIDINTNTPIIKSICKEYYFDNEVYYHFSYNEIGNLRSMDSLNPENMGSWRPSELGTLGGFSWAEVGSYYMTAEPFIPHTEVY